jgi:hypothetical protein
VSANDSTLTLQQATKKLQPKLMDINEAHQKFGHISETMLKITAQRDNLVLTGKLQPCTSQRPVKKDTLMASYAGERIHMDVSGPFPPTLGGHRYWVMLKTNIQEWHGMYLPLIKSKFMELPKKNSITLLV